MHGQTTGGGEQEGLGGSRIPDASRGGKRTGRVGKMVEEGQKETAGRVAWARPTSRRNLSTELQTAATASSPTCNLVLVERLFSVRGVFVL